MLRKSESADSDSETDSDSDNLHGDDVQNVVLPVRDNLEVSTKKKSSLLTVSQPFIEGSPYYMGCIGFVVAVEDVLK